VKACIGVVVSSASASSSARISASIGSGVRARSVALAADVGSACVAATGVKSASCLEASPREQRAGARHHVVRQARDARHRHAVAAVGAAGHESVQEDDVALVLARGRVVVSHRAGPCFFEGAELVVVRREERATAHAIHEVLRDGTRDREAVVGRGPSADLVEDHERARGRAADEGGRLGHLDHEGALPAREVVARADARVNPIDQADVGAVRGHVRAELREDHEERGLTHDRRLARHVRPGDHPHALPLRIEAHVVGHEGARGQRELDHRVTAALELEPRALVDRRAHIAAARRDLGEAARHVELREPGRDAAQLGGGLGHARARALEDLDLERLEPILGRGDRPLELVQLLGRVALAVRDRLLAAEVGRHALEVRARDLDVVAEHPRVADLERRDAARDALALLEREQHITALARQAAQLVDARVRTRAHEPALRGRLRQLVLEHARQLDEELVTELARRADRGPAERGAGTA
jgi:hypothetical protein